ncbi:tetratricopeptide-like helical domain-containing protein [Artemisia annua]|uniref:Tetratricopeptide-like helical domain-containing protein n=1 Tax=Artemisia annua TaxID=35608 RepID=A0A2U1LA03_ARTAN|nr:tetratricopeptide-like helical domain-containing protein [Artemisia annua]
MEVEKKAKKKFYKLATTRPLPSVGKFNKLLDLVFDHLRDYLLSATLFKQMCRIGLPVNNHTANIAFKSYLELDMTALLGYPVLGSCLKKGILVGNNKVSISFNTIIRGFVRSREDDLTMEAERLFKTLFRNDINDQLSFEPDVITYNAIIEGLCKSGNNFTSIGLLRLMDSRGCKPDIVTYNTLIDSFCKDKMIDDASNLFREMVSEKNILPNVHTYNSLIYAFSKMGRWDGVTRMLKQMEELNICLYIKTFRMVIEALCKQGKIKEAKHVIDIMVESGRYPDIVIFNSLIDGYSLLGDMAEARNTFDLLHYRRVEPNVVTYNKVMDGYVKNFMPDAAYDFFCDITAEGIETNEFTHCILGLGSLSDEIKIEDKYREYLKMDTFEDSLALFQYMDDNKLNSHIDVYNILIDRATKCLKFDTARRLFHDLIVKGLKPDSKTYTVMISCLCKGGLLKDAKQLLLKMEKSGCPPNYDETINDILQGYLKFKPFDDVVKFCLTMQAIPFSLTNSNASILLDQLLLRDPHNTSLLSWVNKLK